MKQKVNEYEVYSVCLHYDDYRYIISNKEPWFLLKDILRTTVVWRMDEAVMLLDKEHYMRVSAGGVRRERYFIQWCAIDRLFNDYIKKDTRFEASLSTRLSRVLNEDSTSKKNLSSRNINKFKDGVPIKWYLADKKLFVTKTLTQVLSDNCMARSKKNGAKLRRVKIPDKFQKVVLFDPLVIEGAMNELFIWDTERKAGSLPTRVQLKSKYVKGNIELNYLTINDYIELNGLNLTMSQYNYARLKCNEMQCKTKGESRTVSHAGGVTTNIYDERLISKTFSEIYRRACNYPNCFSYQSVKPEED